VPGIITTASQIIVLWDSFFIIISVLWFKK
jgi:hypothetical protein